MYNTYTRQFEIIWKHSGWLSPNAGENGAWYVKLLPPKCIIFIRTLYHVLIIKRKPIFIHIFLWWYAFLSALLCERSLLVVHYILQSIYLIFMTQNRLFFIFVIRQLWETMWLHELCSRAHCIRLMRFLPHPHRAQPLFCAEWRHEYAKMFG